MRASQVILSVSATHGLIGMTGRRSTTYVAAGLAAVGCVVLATALFRCRDRPAPTPPRDTASEYARACEGGDPSACCSLALMYRSGHGVRRDSGRAFKLFSKACKRGSALGCAGTYEMACDGGELVGCVRLGEMYAEGRGVQMDRPRALALYRRACGDPPATGCGDLAILLERGVHGR
jgi:hypothetical protein